MVLRFNNIFTRMYIKFTKEFLNKLNKNKGVTSYQRMLNYSIDKLLTNNKIIKNCDSFVMSEGVWIKEGFVTRGHANLTPMCSLHMCAQIEACEVDSPSVQPSTWHLYTPLSPPNCRQRGVIWAEMATSGASSAAGEGTSSANSDIFMAGAEASGVASWCSCRGSMEMVAVGEQQCLLGGVGCRTWRNMTWLPIRDHTNPPPLILPQPIKSCPAPLSLTIAPPPLAYSPIVANLNPERRKRNIIWHVRPNCRIGRAKLRKERGWVMQNKKNQIPHATTLAHLSSSIGWPPFLHPHMNHPQLLLLSHHLSTLLFFIWLICGQGKHRYARKIHSMQRGHDHSNS